MRRGDSCAGCGAHHFQSNSLDARPANVKDDDEALSLAADKGRDFNALYCQKCFGPAWLKGGVA